jgi:tRNA(fMet)-specific endonuclease VapC
MALRYLLDTNILSDLIRHPQGTVADRITTVGENTVCTSIIVAAELRSVRINQTQRNWHRR